MSKIFKSNPMVTRLDYYKNLGYNKNLFVW